MPTPDLTGGGGRPDAVDQARAWLAAQTGCPVPADPVPADPVPADPVPADPVGSADRAGPADRTGDLGADDPDADPESVARSIALRKLSAQARTRHELDQAMRTKNVPAEVAASVLDRFEDVGLVDDATFARDWVRSRQQRRHLSRSALRRELQAKGVDREHVDTAVETVAFGDELDAARALVAKKEAATRDLDPVVRQRRLAGALARRGFGSGIVATVLREVRDRSAAGDLGA